MATKRQRKAKDAARRAHADKADRSFQGITATYAVNPIFRGNTIVADEIVHRDVQLETRDVSEDGVIELSFASENPVRDRWSDAPTVLLHEDDNADFSRLDSVLFNHDPNQILGPIEKKWIDADTHKARARVRFDQDEDAQRALAKVRSGSLRGVSVGFVITEAQRVGDGESWKSPGGRSFKGPLTVATRWQPLELSLTPIPADRTVGTDRNLSSGTVPMKMNAQLRAALVERGLSGEANDEEAWSFLNEHPDALTQRTDTNDEPPTSPPSDTNDSDPASITRAERNRVSQLRAIARNAELDDEVFDRWVDSGIGVDAARQAALERVCARMKTPAAATTPRIDMGEDATERFLRDAEYALTRFCSIPIETRKSEIDMIAPSQIVRALCRLRGVRGADYMPIEELMRTRDFAHTSGDFDNLLTNVANKSLQRGYDETPTTYQIWCDIRPLRDFRTNTDVKFGEIANFVETPELMPVKNASVSDAKETYKLKTYATQFSISRQAIINDDTSALARIPRMIGSAAARTINQGVYDHIGQASGVGPTMTEGSLSLFNASHASGSNYTASGGAPTTASLGTGRKLMRLQQGLDARGALNITPVYLMVPAALEQTADELLNGSYLPTAATSALTPSNRNLQLIVDPHLDTLTNGTTAWYLIAASSQVPSVAVGRLGGQTAPVIQRQDGHDVLGTSWVAYVDYVAQAVDHRGIYRNKGV